MYIDCAMHKYRKMLILWEERKRTKENNIGQSLRAFIFKALLVKCPVSLKCWGVLDVNDKIPFLWDIFSPKLNRVDVHCVFFFFFLGGRLFSLRTIYGIYL